MKNARPNKLRRAARMTTLTILVVGLSLIILLPVYFLVVLSLMSDHEAYGMWPLSLVPSFSERFKVEQSETGYRVSVYNRAEADFQSLVESSEPDELSSFIRRKTNCRISSEQLNGILAETAGGHSREFSVRKNLFANYVSLFSVTNDARAALFRSLKTAFLTMAISLTIGGMAGYALARYAFAGKRYFRVSILLARIFPGVAIAIPMVVILGSMGLFDNPVGLALVYAVGQIALSAWITASVFSSIPIELEEAAQVFGATRTGAFLHVTLPLALPGLAACAMVAFIGSWNETIQAVVLTQAKPTFPVVIYQTLVGAKGMINLCTAGGVAMALPAVVFTLIIRKYILRMWGGARV